MNTQQSACFCLRQGGNPLSLHTPWLLLKHFFSWNDGGVKSKCGHVWSLRGGCCSCPGTFWGTFPQSGGLGNFRGGVATSWPSRGCQSSLFFRWNYFHNNLLFKFMVCWKRCLFSGIVGRTRPLDLARNGGHLKLTARYGRRLAKKFNWAPYRATSDRTIADEDILATRTQAPTKPPLVFF